MTTSRPQGLNLPRQFAFVTERAEHGQKTSRALTQGPLDGGQLLSGSVLQLFVARASGAVLPTVMQ